LVELAPDDRAATRLAEVAAGRLTGTIALGDDVRATRRGEQWVLDGAASTVVDGDRADEIVVVARDQAGRSGAFLVDRGHAQVSPRMLVDPTVQVADIALAGVEVEGDAVLAEPGDPRVARALARVVEHATVAVAVSTVGTCRRIFEMTLEYTKVREQFGRPIGSFQALKHRLADMFLAVERATALAYYAALTIAEDDPRRAEAASLAKIAAGDCQRLLAEDGLQLHGGIGMTWEHDLHFFLKRAKVGEALFGSSVAHRAALAKMLALVDRP
jgi:alkylation response protein AidB-like acyl-CoA dehydrogenase